MKKSTFTEDQITFASARSSGTPPAGVCRQLGSAPRVEGC